MTFKEAIQAGESGKFIRRQRSAPGVFIYFTKGYFVPIDAIAKQPQRRLVNAEFLKAQGCAGLAISDYWNKWTERKKLIVGYAFDEFDRRAADWEVYEP